MLSWVTRTHISSARAKFLWDMREILGLGKTYQLERRLWDCEKRMDA